MDKKQKRNLLSEQKESHTREHRKLLIWSDLIANAARQAPTRSLFDGQISVDALEPSFRWSGSSFEKLLKLLIKFANFKSRKHRTMDRTTRSETSGTHSSIDEQQFASKWRPIRWGRFSSLMIRSSKPDWLIRLNFQSQIRFQSKLARWNWILSKWQSVAQFIAGTHFRV